MPRELLKDEVRKTFVHELTHHRESLANYVDLEIEDAEFIKSYEEAKKL